MTERAERGHPSSNNVWGEKEILTIGLRFKPNFRFMVSTGRRRGEWKYVSDLERLFVRIGEEKSHGRAFVG